MKLFNSLTPYILLGPNKVCRVRFVGNGKSAWCWR